MPKKSKKIKSNSITSFVVSATKQPESTDERKTIKQDKTKNKEESAEQKDTFKKNQVAVEEPKGNILELEEMDENENEDKIEENNEEAGKGAKSGLSANINLDKYLEKLQKVKLKDKIFFTKNLGVMIKAGLSLGKALEALADQTQNKKFKSILKDVEKNVKKGTSFSESLKKYPQTFNNLFVSMIASGEESGNLEEVLKQLHKQMTRDHALISKIRGAMIYPIIVITAMIGIGVGMVIFVIPKFMSIFEEANVALPFATRVLINVSNFVSQHGLVVLISTILILIILIKLFRTKKGKSILHNIFLKLPILAPIVKKINLARFSRTLSSLLKTDIAIVKAFAITTKVLGNVHYQEALAEAKEKIKKGEHLKKSLANYDKLFPAVVIQMISVGEETGALDSVLDELATFYEEDVDQTMKNLPTIIEPVLMLVLGAGVGFMAVAVLMPMYSLSQAF